jgi:hypothetical protein
MEKADAMYSWRSVRFWCAMCPGTLTRVTRSYNYIARQPLSLRARLPAYLPNPHACLHAYLCKSIRPDTITKNQYVILLGGHGVADVFMAQCKILVCPVP